MDLYLYTYYFGRDFFAAVLLLVTWIYIEFVVPLVGSSTSMMDLVGLPGLRLDESFTFYTVCTKIVIFSKNLIIGS